MEIDATDAFLSTMLSDEIDFANVLYNWYFQLCYNHHHDTFTQNILHAACAIYYNVFFY